MCFAAYYKRGISGCQAEGEGKGKGKRARGQKRSQQGEGLLLEGSTDGATLEWLGWAVVVHHAVLSHPIGGEEQGAEFGHL